MNARLTLFGIFNQDPDISDGDTMRSDFEENFDRLKVISVTPAHEGSFDVTVEGELEDLEEVLKAFREPSGAPIENVRGPHSGTSGSSEGY